jgi:hypothetical protein
MSPSGQKRDFFCAVHVMSAQGQKQTFALHQAMSALPPKPTTKADIPAYP